MNLPNFFIAPLSIIIGCSAGLVYGCTFMLQHRSLFGRTTQSTSRSIAFFFVRLGILLFIGNYLLQAPLIPSILGSIGFFGTFWLIILQVKARSYERA